ncbi:CDP-glycerol glycerophosphotransferase family protein [Proteinivorax hydrogeniformans]|uniref:CDP-glycerol glycerophosphotransferase family protein n=1 Tax=Proteinivorax hydrogeniformans TaxID=1826727 RepID=A0AAU8HX15_9FIRM
MKNFIKNSLILGSIVLNTVFYFLSGFSKRKPNRIMFGSWSGYKIGDNPMHLLDYLKNNENIEIIWCGKKHLKDIDIINHKNVQFVQYNTLKSLYYALTSKYVFISNTYRDIALINLFKGATFVQLWHGFGLKKTLATNKRSRLKKLYYELGKNSYEKYSYFISSSELNTKKLLSAFKNNGITNDKVIASGQPKNDFLLKERSNSYIQVIKERYKLKYAIPTDKKIILYLPTFRDNKPTFSFSELKNKDELKLEKELNKNNAIIIEKMHFKDSGNKSKRADEHIFKVCKTEEINELLLISDMLISDYSSCYLDYLLLDRPIIHFAYDYNEYKTVDRGFYYDLDVLAAGPITYTLEETIEQIAKILNNQDNYKQKRRAIKQLAMTYETGDSCKKISDVVLSENVGSALK